MPSTSARVRGLVRRVSPAQAGADVTLALLVLGLSVLVPAGTAGTAITAGLLFAAAVATRRLAPWAMVALGTAAGALQVLTSTASLASVVAYGVLFYATGNDRDPWIRRAGLTAIVIASVGGGIAAHTNGLFGVYQTWPGAGLAGFLIAAVAGSSWLAGALNRQRERAAAARVATRIARVEARRSADLYAHEQERNRIARDMHDVVAHTLAVIVAQAEGARYAAADHPEVTDRSLRTIAATGRDALADIRSLLGELRGDQPGDLRLTSEVAGTDTALFQRMREAGLRLQVEESGEPKALTSEVAGAARWILTEAMTNALKHGDLSRPVTVRQTWTEELSITVTNTRSSRSAGSAPAPGGHGLTGITERAVLVGGHAEHGTEPPDRFALRLRLPCVADRGERG